MRATSVVVMGLLCFASACAALQTSSSNGLIQHKLATTNGLLRLRGGAPSKAAAPAKKSALASIAAAVLTPKTAVVAIVIAAVAKLKDIKCEKKEETAKPVAVNAPVKQGCLGLGCCGL